MATSSAPEEHRLPRQGFVLRRSDVHAVWSRLTKLSLKLDTRLVTRSAAIIDTRPTVDELSVGSAGVVELSDVVLDA